MALYKFCIIIIISVYWRCWLKSCRGPAKTMLYDKGKQQHDSRAGRWTHIYMVYLYAKTLADMVDGD